MASSHFSVIYDANVLYPAPLRDFLMHLATTTGLFRARWSDDIHEEWIRNLSQDRPDIPIDKIERIRHLMDTAVPDALIDRGRYEAISKSLNLPDPDDNHVLAAAIVSQSELIISFNLKDFPKTVTQRYQVEAKHPDEFISDLIHLDELAVYQALCSQQQTLKNPPKSIHELLDILAKRGLPASTARLRSLASR